MSYRFVWGASGAGKSHDLMEYAIQASAVCGKESILYIVPDQSKMQMEQELVAAHPAHGIMNMEVLSFGRLSYRIFEELGVQKRTVLDDMGKTLVLRRIAGKIKQQLPVIGGNLQRTGYIAEVKSALSEFMQYGIGLCEMDTLIEYAKEQGALQARLQDLRLLYDAFLEYERERFATTEETLDLLAEAIPSSALVKKSILIFDGFTGFTPVQNRVLCALILHAKEVIVSLDFGQDGGPSMEQVLTEKNAGPKECMFYLSRKTVRDLYILAQEAGAVMGENLALDGCIDKYEREKNTQTQEIREAQTQEIEEVQTQEIEKAQIQEIKGTQTHQTSVWRFRQNPVLGHMEAHLFRSPVIPWTGGEQALRQSIHIRESSSRLEEVRQMCITIRRLVEEQGYLYRDFAAVCGDQTAYQDALERMCRRYEIPVYIDRTSPVVANPLTETIRSALQIGISDYAYEQVFRYLRSGLSSLTADETDRLENYCLERGIRSRKKWGRVFDEKVEPLRLKFLEEIAPLTMTGRIGESVREDNRQENAGAAPKMTVRMRTEALYRFLVQNQVQESMEKYAEAFTEQMDLVRAKEYSQIYPKLMELLDQIVDLLGDEPISARDYLSLLETGIAEIRVGTLPQKADRLVVGDMERTRLHQVKVLFVLGVNDGSIPKASTGGGILSDLDREFLQGSGMELSPTPRQQMYIQRLYLYMNMTKPTEQLYLSYARVGDDGKTLRPSYLIQTMRRLFPELSVEVPEEEPLAGQLMAGRDSLDFLAGGLREMMDGYYDRDKGKMESLLTVYGVLTAGCGAEEKMAENAQRLTKAALLRYRPRPISRQTAKALYGRFLRGSVSRLETCAQCFGRHYLQYGLGLKERKAYVPETSDVGAVLHESMEAFAGKLRKQGLSWTDFDYRQGQQLSEGAIMETAAGYQDLLLYATARSSASLERMKRILGRTVETLQYQLRRGSFVPQEYELSFGTKTSPLGEIVIPLHPWVDDAETAALYLNGRIDRLDLCQTEDGIYIKVLDYKSGLRDLDPKKIRLGLQLQLMVYMEAARAREQSLYPEKSTVPAAMLYYRFQDPFVDGDFAVLPVENDADKEPGTGETDASILAAQLKELCPRGLVNKDPQVLSLLDKEPGNQAHVIPVSFKKDGTLRSGSGALSTEEYEELAEAAREVMCQLGEEILRGNVTLSPVEDGQISACEYCPYKNVCGFDPKTPGYEKRNI